MFWHLSLKSLKQICMCMWQGLEAMLATMSLGGRVTSLPLLPCCLHLVLTWHLFVSHTQYSSWAVLFVYLFIYCYRLFFICHLLCEYLSLFIIVFADILISCFNLGLTDLFYLKNKLINA